jgi:hypothetical protein
LYNLWLTGGKVSNDESASTLTTNLIPCYAKLAWLLRFLE